jgi:hypothetical protein
MAPSERPRIALANELANAVEARARARLTRRLLKGEDSRHPKAKRQTLKQRLDRRATLAANSLRELQVQARLLISDRNELRDVLTELGRLHRVFRKHVAEHHRAFDLPAHRPGDAERDFRAACQTVMKRHHIGPSEAATIIVRNVAPSLSNGARTDLLGSWRNEREQIQHLADSIRKRV